MKIFVMVGFPASGKSTVAKHIQACFSDKNIILSTDDYIEQKAIQENVSYDMYFERYIQEATLEMNIKLKRMIDVAEPLIIWDQTNLSARKRKRIINQITEYCAGADNFYDIVAVEMQTPFTTCLERAITRSQKINDKNIPSNVWQSMLKSYEPVSNTELFSKIIKI